MVIFEYWSTGTQATDGITSGEQTINGFVATTNVCEYEEEKIIIDDKMTWFRNKWLKNRHRYKYETLYKR